MANDKNEERFNVFLALNDLADRTATLAKSHPAIALGLASLAKEIGRIDGFCRGDGDAEMRAVVTSFYSGIGDLVDALEETTSASYATPALNLQARELMADLLALAPDDDHHEYASGTIDELRSRARALLVRG